MSTVRAIEALLLMATESLSVEELAAALGVPGDEAQGAVDEITSFYEEHDRGFRLAHVAGGYRFATVPEVREVIEAWLVADQRTRLSQAALETLAVVAYLQPVSRARIAGVRGVNVDGVVRTLVLRGLIEASGEDAVTGAVTFVTTPLFLEKLGLAGLDELPELAPLLPDAVALETELGRVAATGLDEEEHHG